MEENNKEEKRHVFLKNLESQVVDKELSLKHYNEIFGKNKEEI